ncbi:inositol monophosphatase family protein [Streptococcus panodentis]|uniref:inositol monophosphatase family protein n=1 Tax=Streptococcus panodentis TaxID=1581472 RepID=UPI001AE291FF|nr:inositol monophosphatase family protein [Streptococcus panodentis]
MENKFRFAKEIIYQAGAFLLDHLYDDLDVKQKSSPTDLVTEMDQKIQNDLVKKILARYPEDAILAEENGLRHSIADGSVWVIDPIDGTTNFITQKADFAIMLAYFENGIGQFGLIYDVTRDQLYHGGGLFDVYCNDRKLPFFENKPFSDYLMASNAGMLKHNHWGLADFSRECLGVRVYGSAGISFAKVLSGGLVAYFSYNWPWDYAAAYVMAAKLGFVIQTLDGKEPDFQRQEPIMMAPQSKLKDLQKYLEKGKEQ